MTEQEAFNNPEMKVILLLSGYARELSEGKDFVKTTNETAEQIVKLCVVSKMSLSDKEIEDHIWEYFPEGLNAKDKENNTETYKRYLQIIELVKDMRNIP